MEIPIPAATPATVAAIITAAGAAAITAVVEGITAVVEGITAVDCVQDVSSRGTRPESIVRSTNLLDGPCEPIPQAQAPGEDKEANWLPTPVFQGVCGSLASLILANAAAGAASGALTEVGITGRFMKELATVLIPSRSALFVLTRRPTPDKDRLLEELKGLGGKVFMTWLSHEVA